MILSFGWPGMMEAVLAERKTVTRRDWSDSYASRFQQGDIVTAYNRQPAWGGRPFALIEIQRIEREPLSRLLRNADYAMLELVREGYDPAACLEPAEEFSTLFGDLRHGDPWRIEFRLVSRL